MCVIYVYNYTYTIMVTSLAIVPNYTDNNDDVVYNQLDILSKMYISANDKGSHTTVMCTYVRITD